MARRRLGERRPRHARPYGAYRRLPTGLMRFGDGASKQLRNNAPGSSVPA